MGFSEKKQQSGKASTSRRRVISILASAASLSAVGLSFSTRSAAKNNPRMFTWEGYALGAQSTIKLAHYTRNEAEKIINIAVSEIKRLERIFSLKVPYSEISILNAKGKLSRPSFDMLSLLTEAKRYSEISEGAFDYTVQPLWSLYSNYFRKNPNSKSGPRFSDIEKQLKLVDYRALEFNPLFVSFDRDGMKLTLNGIAQGYITDRVSDLLRKNGLSNVLVSLGETRALDSHPEGRPWQVDLKDPKSPNSISRKINLNNMAVATSGGYGTVFDDSGQFHHLFDPRTGKSAWTHVGVSVISPRATAADALSTALYITEEKDAEKLVRRASGVTAILTKPDGTEYILKS